MRWPWRSRAVDEALSGSADRLAETKRRQAELEPVFRKLRTWHERNHFEDAVLHGFRVVDR